MRYTIRSVPPDLDRRLRQLAEERGKSLNAVVLEVLLAGAGLSVVLPRRDLSAIAGSWIADAGVDAALDEQRRVDPELWSCMS